MNLWRSPARPSRRVPVRPAVERLDDRIVPDTTGVTPTGTVTTDPTSTTGQTTTTPADGSATTTITPSNGTSSTQSNGTATTTTTTGGQTTTTVTPADGSSTTTTTTPADGTSTTTTTTPPAATVFAVGVDAGHTPQVRVYDTTGQAKYDFLAYNQEFRGGVRVATADVTGDGTVDFITGAGPGARPTVKVFDGATRQQLVSFNAYDSNFKGGVFVAAGDVNGDGRADIVTGPGETGGSHVKIFDSMGLFPPGDVAAAVEPGPTAHVLREWFAYDPMYGVGSRVAVGDVDGDGKADVISGAGQTGGPHVRVFSGADNMIIREWMAFDTLFNGGVYVAAGDVNGDGRADVVTGMGFNGIGQVKVFDGRNGRQAYALLTEQQIVRASARVDVFDYDRDGDNDVVVSVLNKLHAYDGKTFVRVGGLTPMDGGYSGGVFFG